MASEMRSLFDIVESAKDGQMPTHQECYWAMLALDALRHFNKMDLMKIYTAATEQKPSLTMHAESGYSEAFKREKKAFEKSPKDWVGPSNDPANPEYQRMRKAAFNVLKGVEAKHGQ